MLGISGISLVLKVLKDLWCDFSDTHPISLHIEKEPHLFSSSLCLTPTKTRQKA